MNQAEVKEELVRYEALKKNAIEFCSKLGILKECREEIESSFSFFSSGEFICLSHELNAIVKNKQIKNNNNDFVINKLKEQKNFHFSELNSSIDVQTNEMIFTPQKQIDNQQLLYCVDKGHIFLNKWACDILSHEFVHVLEMKDKSRILKDDFGFLSLKEDGLIFESKDLTKEKYYLHSVVRESRVVAIQEIVQKHQGATTLSALDLVGRWQEWYWRNRPIKRFKSFAALKMWSMKMQLSTLKQWDISRVLDEWEVCKKVYTDYAKLY